MQYLRGTRADPPGRAANDKQRRVLYAAALEQFEQLRTAAAAIGPAARPLPLFYALSQAGRAIVAARGEVPLVRGHGLSEARGQDDLRDVLQRAVKRASHDQRNKPAPAEDAFGAVSRAIGSPDFDDPIDIGAAWAALPIATPMPDTSWKTEWRPSVFVSELDAQDDAARSTVRHQPRFVALTSLPGHPTISIADGLHASRYPQLGGIELHVNDVGDKVGGRAASWHGIAAGPDVVRLLEATQRASSDRSERALIPTLPGGEAPMRPLMLWWVILFGLSIFARYHPDVWAQTLRVDDSKSAVPLEVLLEQAIAQLPGLVYDEIFGFNTA